MSGPNPISRPRPLRERIGGLRSSPSLRGSPAPAPPVSLITAVAARRKAARTCPNCSTPDIGELEGQVVCLNCGAIISDSVIVNEIAFDEAPSGAAHVQGTTVHDGQRGARSVAVGFRRGGRSSEETAENALRIGKEEITRLANALHINGMVEKAYMLYQIARIHQFQRPIKENAAICLYVSCRQTKGNTTMLIDFAEQIRQNVYDLGATYKSFIKAVSLEDELDPIPIIEIEPLLLKYAKRLEFGDATRQVAADAASILARMDRDWMVTGRQPFALCGACLILAARMNNFRRSIREVVFIVRAGDVTILKRLKEFQRTTAGRLTVQQFRDVGLRLKEQADPPCFTEKRYKNMRKRKRGVAMFDVGTSTRDATVDLTGSSTSGSPAPRRDADGFVIPDVPIDPSLVSPANNAEAENRAPTAQMATRVSTKGSRTSKGTTPDGSPEVATPEEQMDEVLEEIEGPSTKKRRTRKKEKPDPLVIQAEDLLDDNELGELEAQISQIVDRHITEDAYILSEARAKALADAEKAKVAVDSRRRKVRHTEEIDPEEFDDDPEVNNCLLNEREAEVKERIWVTSNWEWLREQQAKALAAQLDEAKGKKKKTPGTSRRRLKDDNDQEPAATPAEASRRMLEKRSYRAAFSKHLNYDKLMKIYGRDEGDDDDNDDNDDNASRATSPAQTVDGSVEPESAPERFQITRTKKPQQQLPTPATTQEASRVVDRDEVVEEEDADIGAPNNTGGEVEILEELSDLDDEAEPGVDDTMLDDDDMEDAFESEDEVYDDEDGEEFG
ncbi:hypothetical protein EJ06DRAFT_19224 [Trichodelitschia bisporula]|uniref:B-related factor 1 n=1 Tax=Trichodelitschia bisporula TaxID=703511 RepID=A0A6G1IB22_9PEZI|nr:hypothetical protein EJ06DRAFT_19224 [Trichodelitschia bisporula]